MEEEYWLQRNKKTIEFSYIWVFKPQLIVGSLAGLEQVMLYNIVTIYWS